MPLSYALDMSNFFSTIEKIISNKGFCPNYLWGNLVHISIPAYHNLDPQKEFKILKGEPLIKQIHYI